MKLRPRAEEDLEEIWLYTLETWSRAQADGYLSEIIDDMEAAASGRKIGRPVKVLDGYQKLPNGSHVIYFRAGEDEIDVVRILHQRMDAERHF